MEIEVVNRQHVARVDRSTVRKYVAYLMGRVACLAPGRQWGEISIVLMDDAGIASVNCRHFRRRAPTDVISFRFDPLPGEEGRNSGDVLVNVERALEEGLRRQRGPAGWDFSRELALYLAHGCDHLAGAKDDTPAGRTRMRRRELRWLRKAPTGGPGFTLLAPVRKHDREN